MTPTLTTLGFILGGSAAIMTLGLGAICSQLERIEKLLRLIAGEPEK